MIYSLNFGKYKPRHLEVEIIGGEGKLQDITQDGTYGLFGCSNNFVNGVWTPIVTFVILQIKENNLIQQRKHTLYKGKKGYYCTICKHKCWLDTDDVEKHFDTQEGE